MSTTTQLSGRAQHLAKKYAGYTTTQLNQVALDAIEVLEGARAKGHTHAARYIRLDVIALRELIDSMAVQKTG